MIKEKLDHYVDNIGSTLSAVCLVHCLLLPVILATLPFVAFMGVLKTPIAEMMMIIFAVINSIIGVYTGFSKHKNYLIVSMFISGIVFLLTSMYIQTLHIGPDILTPIGAGTLGVAHIINRRLCKSCPSCNHQTDNHINHE